jgi:hypothetical protein
MSDIILKKSFLEIFKRLSFREYIFKVYDGLHQDHKSGVYKWSQLQLIRLWSPIFAIFIPIFVVFLIFLFSTFNSVPSERTVTVTMLEPEKIEKIDLLEPEPLKPDPIIEPIEFHIPDITPNVNIQDTVEAFTPMEDISTPILSKNVQMIKSPVVIKGIIAGRTPTGIGNALDTYGAPHGSEQSVLRALRWLKKNQNDDGSWDKTKPAMTSLALLVYLAHGETPSSEEFGYTVRKGTEWLIANQTVDGHFKGRDNHDYCQPIAAYALSELFALTKIPMVGEAATKALDVVIKGQNASGGWNYNCKPSDRDDTSYMGWCAQALKAAKLANLEVDGLEEARKQSIKGFQKNYREADGYGTFGYTAPGNSGLTGVGVLCLQLLGRADSREVRNGLNSLERATFNWDGGGIYNKNYFWYYITQAKFHAGGDTWDNWNKKFSTVLIGNQTVIKSAILDSKGNKVDIAIRSLLSLFTDI